MNLKYLIDENRDRIDVLEKRADKHLLTLWMILVLDVLTLFIIYYGR